MRTAKGYLTLHAATPTYKLNIRFGMGTQTDLEFRLFSILHLA